MFGFIILNVKTWKSRRASGVSIKTLQLYCLVFFRLTCSLSSTGILAYDKSGDWLYHIIELVAFLFLSSVLYGCMVPFKGTYQSIWIRRVQCAPLVTVPSTLLVRRLFCFAIFIHPSLNSDFMR
jgi:hypothetical protein